MTWFKVDDGFWAHPKTLALSDSAISLWLKAGTWASQMLTDGMIPANALQMLRSSEEAANELVRSGLWMEQDGEYQFHHWADYQPDAETEKAKRAKKSRDSRKAACVRWHGPNCTRLACMPDSESHAVGNADSTPNASPMDKCESVSAEVEVASVNPEYEALLDLLDELIVENGSKRPTRGKRNRDAIRLLVEKDGRTIEQVEAAIRWCQADEFWRGNILSASKLREQYDKLRLAAIRQKASGPGVLTPNQERGMGVVHQLREMEETNAEITDG